MGLSNPLLAVRPPIMNLQTREIGQTIQQWRILLAEGRRRHLRQVVADIAPDEGGWLAPEQFARDAVGGQDCAGVCMEDDGIWEVFDQVTGPFFLNLQPRPEPEIGER